MKEYRDLLQDDDKYNNRAKELTKKVKDINEFLYELPIDPPRGHLKTTVTYQDPCHLAHAQRITAAPRQILLSIPGLELAEMEDAAMCCGAAGLYSVLQKELAGRRGMLASVEHGGSVAIGDTIHVLEAAPPG